jgi:hypothetical protein
MYNFSYVYKGAPPGGKEEQNAAKVPIQEDGSP